MFFVFGSSLVIVFLAVIERITSLPSLTKWNKLALGNDFLIALQWRLITLFTSPYISLFLRGRIMKLFVYSCILTLFAVFSASAVDSLPTISTSIGIPGIEIAGGQIDEVTGIRCTLACFPIRYEGGEASIVRLVAIVEK